MHCIIKTHRQKALDDGVVSSAYKILVKSISKTPFENVCCSTAVPCRNQLFSHFTLKCRVFTLFQMPNQRGEQTAYPQVGMAYRLFLTDIRYSCFRRYPMYRFHLSHPISDILCNNRILTQPIVE